MAAVYSVTTGTEMVSVSQHNADTSVVVQSIHTNGVEVVATLTNDASQQQPHGSPPKQLGLQNQLDGTQQQNANNPQNGPGNAMKGRLVRKRFGRKYFTGTVQGYEPDTKWYKVHYEDGDSEELDWKELEPYLVPEEPPSPKQEQPSSEQEEPPSKKRSNPASTPKGKKARKTKKVDEIEEQIDLNKDGAAQNAVVETQAVGVKRGRPTKGTTASTTPRKSSRVSAPQPGKKGEDTADKKNAKKANATQKAEEKGKGVEEAEKGKTTTLRGAKLKGRKLKKDFNGKLYEGVVTGYDKERKYYKILYPEDQDREEMDWKELEPLLLPEDEQASTQAGTSKSTPKVIQSGTKLKKKPVVLPKPATRSDQRLRPRHGRDMLSGTVFLTLGFGDVFM